jgi:hypothetical protein
MSALPIDAGKTLDFLRMWTKLPVTRVRDTYDTYKVSNALPKCGVHTSWRTAAFAVSYGERAAVGLFRWQTLSEVTATSPADISSI